MSPIFIHPNDPLLKDLEDQAGFEEAQRIWTEHRKECSACSGGTLCPMGMKFFADTQEVMRG